MKSPHTFGYRWASLVFFFTSIFLYIYVQVFALLLFWILCLCAIIIESAWLLVFRISSKKNIFEAFDGVLQTSFRHTMILVAIVVAGMGGSMFYYNEISPVSVSLYTLTNGEKTVQFQEMSHIATPNFFTSVKNNLTLARKNGFRIFYEGVRVENPETQKEFQKALWAELNTDTYDKIAQLAGLQAQSTDIVGIDEKQDKNVDITLEEVLAKYKEKVSSGTLSQTLATQNPISLDELFSQGKIAMTEKQQQFFAYTLKAALNGMLQESNKANSSILESFGKEAILDTILNDRNKTIVDAINTSEDKKIYVIYGALHFPGVYASLKKEDVRWRIVKQQIALPLAK